MAGTSVRHALPALAVMLLVATVTGRIFPLSEGPSVEPVTPSRDVPFLQYKSDRLYVSGSPAPAPVAVTWPVLGTSSAPVDVAFARRTGVAFLLTVDALYAVNGTEALLIDVDVTEARIAPSDDGVFIVSGFLGLVVEVRCTGPADCAVARRVETPRLGDCTVAVAAPTRPEVWIGTSQGVFVLDAKANTVSAVNVTDLPAGSTVTALALDDERAAVAIGSAVFLFDGARWTHILIGGVVDSSPTALAFVPATSGRDDDAPLLFIGTQWCLNVVGANGIIERVSGAQGLPWGNVTALRSDGDNHLLWVGTTWGVVSLDVGSVEWRYFAGQRWLPDDDVRAVALAAGGSPMLVATAHGVARFTHTTMTLADKAEALAALTYPRHDRHGYVNNFCNLARWGDLSSWSGFAGDNDGSWTGNYVASLVFRYIATGDAQAKALAWKHYRAIEFLHNVTGVPGLIARTVVKCGEPHQGGDVPDGWHNSTACYEGEDAPGATRCCWTWKGDTSTDETDGHYWSLALVHDKLAETDAERGRVAGLLCTMTAYIVDHGYMYRDVTGHNTTWGYWAPEVLNGVPGKPEERGLNSLEIVSYLGTAMHLCPVGTTQQPRNTTWASALAYLVRRHGYGVNLLNTHLTAPDGVAWFDFVNAFSTYQNMHWHGPWDAPVSARQDRSGRVGDEPPLTAAELSVLKAQVYASLEAYWSAPTASASSERDALFSTMYSVITSKKGNDDPYWMLRRYPMELVTWPAQNSHRLDVTLMRDFIRIGADGANLSTTPLPPDEGPGTINAQDQDSNFQVDGGTGYWEHSPVTFLLAYWFGKAAKLLV